jgi:hypothetical protein
MRNLLLLILLASCAAPEPFTWRDAVTTWSDAWCAANDRCNPGYVQRHYGDQATCVSTESADVCAALFYPQCELVYPEERMALAEQCYGEQCRGVAMRRSHRETRSR